MEDNLSYPYNMLDLIFGKVVDINAIDEAELTKELDAFIETLDEKEKKYFDVFFKQGLTLEQMAQKLNLDKETTHMLYARILRKLRHPTHSSRFKRFT